MGVTVRNIFRDIGASLGEEQFLTLWQNDSVKIERIVSHAHSSPENFWYDQAEDEWVIIVRGGATLEFDTGEVVKLQIGDYLAIPRHIKRRVAQTDKETIWLAVHIR